MLEQIFSEGGSIDCYFSGRLVKRSTLSLTLSASRDVVHQLAHFIVEDLLQLSAVSIVALHFLISLRGDTVALCFLTELGALLLNRLVLITGHALEHGLLNGGLRSIHACTIHQQ